MLSKQAVLISIHREHAERILDGLKTLEIRKTAPTVEAFPYTIYMYETKGTGSGLVVGEFKCRGHIKTNCFHSKTSEALRATGADSVEAYGHYIAGRACLSVEELIKYADTAKNKKIVAWDVSAPVRYQYPRPLSQYGITTAPQSWCYVVANT